MSRSAAKTDDASWGARLCDLCSPSLRLDNLSNVLTINNSRSEEAAEMPKGSLAVQSMVFVGL